MQTVRITVISALAQIARLHFATSVTSDPELGGGGFQVFRVCDSDMRILPSRLSQIILVGPPG